MDFMDIGYMDGTNSWSCPVASFFLRGVEISCYITTE